VSSKTNRIVEVLSKVNGAGIVYCRSRRRTKEISDLLNLNNISSDFYHAGLKQEERNSKQAAWLHNRTRVIVCTNAFGMGIDKPDVRIVIHADVPDCLENYYQEAGRAGRDGKRSYAVLLYNEEEMSDLEAMVRIKFPGLLQIRKVYQSLMNYLQIPAGCGEGNYYEFDLGDFTRNFAHDTLETIAVLKTLEQEKLVYFNEQVFLPTKVQVIAEKQLLYEFEKENSKLGALIKALLRSYEGIIDQPVNINEKVLASVLRSSAEDVTRQLQELQRYAIVRYEPIKEKPQVYLVTNRVIAGDLKINTRTYNKRKKKFEERVAAMKRYVHASNQCRSVIIGNYFGDQQIQPCGICDNCLNQKKKGGEWKGV
jgi:ATP-dependent DNA helicase RecQ